MIYGDLESLSVGDIAEVRRVKSSVTHKYKESRSAKPIIIGEEEERVSVDNRGGGRQKLADDGKSVGEGHWRRARAVF